MQMGLGITNGAGRTGFYAAQAFQKASDAEYKVDHAPSLNPATPTQIGLMSAADKAKLDDISEKASSISVGATAPTDTNATWYKTEA